MGVVKTIFEKRFFAPWRQGRTKYGASIWEDANLELFITGTCNQKCEYCYLVRHDELYPHDIRDPELIKKNLHIFLQWCLDNKFSFHQVDLFSGEIWHAKFGWDILDILLEYVKKGISIDTIILPTNGSFVMYDEAVNNITRIIEEFKQCGTFFQFSGSIDGGIVDCDTRQGNTDNITKVKTSEEFYERFFNFWSHYHYLFHPMVAAANIGKWKENWEWWKEKCKEYGYNPYNDVMMLEVRNDDWNKDNIKQYTDFLDYIIDDTFKNEFHSDVKSFTNYLFLTDIYNAISGGYVNFGLTESGNYQGCTISDEFTVRLGDLTIPACHRTAYDNLLYGKFIVEDDKIVDIEEMNSQFATSIYMMNRKLCSPGCDNCVYNFYCMRGCYGAQVEVNKDPMMPIPSVCKLFKAKINFLIDKFEKMGVIDEMRKIDITNSRYEDIQKQLSVIEAIKKEREDRK